MTSRKRKRGSTRGTLRVRTNVTLLVLLARYQVEPSTRASYALLIGKFIEHRTR